ncbi:MAG: aldehyde dehydrogenase family protein [Planctomycetes bacterium]|nr:aldehyde dehydrogenase family protein [Planctomycetota bacterium]
MGEHDDKSKSGKHAEGVARNYVDSERPGSEFDTREMPAVPDELDETPADESVAGIFVNPNKPGSTTDTIVHKRDELEETKADPPSETPAKEAGEFTAADSDDDDEDATAMSTRKREVFDDLETREVPSLSDDWKKRASDVAAAMGEPSEMIDAFGDPIEPDASLAASVAAASGEMPLPTTDEPSKVAGPVLEKARAAQAEWAKLRFEQRLPFFDALRAEMVSQRSDYVPAMATAVGRPMVEALTGEYLPVLEVLRTLDEVVPPLLVEHHSAGPPTTHDGLTACVRMVPYGVVLLTNGQPSPFAYPMTLMIDALAAGNAVILCGAEHHPRINETMRKMFRRANFPENLVQVIGGDTETIRVIVEAGPDKLIFDGDSELGSRLAQRCVSAGCEFQFVRKAKDMLVVLKNADLERALTAALTGAFASGGMRQGAVERIVVEDGVYDEFRMRFIDAIRTMNSHHAQLASINDAYNPRRAQMLIDDAIAKGARVTYPAGEEPGRWIHWKAGIIEALPANAKLSSERLEGPGCALYRTDKPAEEALKLLRILPANNVSVMGTPGRELTAQLEALPASRVSINEPLLGGAGLAGGAPLGPDLPRTMCGPHSMLRPKLIVHTEDNGRRIAWFPYTDDKAYALMDAMEAMYGTAAGKRLKAAFKLAINPTMRRLIKDGE